MKSFQAVVTYFTVPNELEVRKLEEKEERKKSILAILIVMLAFSAHLFKWMHLFTSAQF